MRRRTLRRRELVARIEAAEKLAEDLRGDYWFLARLYDDVLSENRRAKRENERLRAHIDRCCEAVEHR